LGSALFRLRLLLLCWRFLLLSILALGTLLAILAFCGLAPLLTLSSLLRLRSPVLFLLSFVVLFAVFGLLSLLGLLALGFVGLFLGCLDLSFFIAVPLDLLDLIDNLVELLSGISLLYFFGFVSVDC